MPHLFQPIRLILIIVAGSTQRHVPFGLGEDYGADGDEEMQSIFLPVVVR